MTTKLRSLVLLAALFVFAPSNALADLSNYSQNFDGLDRVWSSSLAVDGWEIYTSVLDTDGTTFLYGYGPFSAPNWNQGFSAITFGEGGTAPTNQHMVVYSDYTNGDHSAGRYIEANVFQQRSIVPTDVGSQWRFTFYASNRDLIAPSTALGFIKVLDPDNGFTLTQYEKVDTSSLPDDQFVRHDLYISIVPSMIGQVLQFGFSNMSTQFNPTGVNYDSIQFVKIPEPTGLGLVAFAAMSIGLRRRRRTNR